MGQNFAGQPVSTPHHPQSEEVLPISNLTYSFSRKPRPLVPVSARWCKQPCPAVLYLSVIVAVPHVIDGAAGPSHEHGSHAEQGQHAPVREAAGRGRQPDAPRTRQVQQPRPCGETKPAAGLSGEREAAGGAGVTDPWPSPPRSPAGWCSRMSRR